MAVLAAGAAAFGFGGAEPERPEAESRAFALVQVTEETLTDYVSFDGQVGYGPTTPLAVKAAGTVTWLPAAGSVVKRGQVLTRVDETPAVLFYGATPMYRPLTEQAKGADVKQIEANLQKLGYGGFTVDDTFSASTTAAVKRWQRDLGLTPTGTVEAERIIFGPGPIRVERHLARIGAASPADVLAYTGTTKLVTATLDAGDAGWAAPGTAVAVTRPGGATTAGRVEVVGQAEPSEGGAAAQGVSVTVSVADQKALTGAERGPVEVRYARQERKDVLTVPVGALLALAEGGYGLEVAEGEAARIVAVKTGLFADGKVEVTGPDLRPGMTVRMPK
ncbi:peptidoglycan-binding domain-containing protein [Catellatospora sp. NPDC049133]|uniref:peptidoglycan-binding domain-containing protein n=1 Tax=Catellatospora sp. NPDC049133 TaxID=3155499 RepID=UPI00340DEE1C